MTKLHQVVYKNRDSNNPIKRWKTLTGVALAVVGFAVRFLVGDSVTDPLPDDVGS